MKNIQRQIRPGRKSRRRQAYTVRDRGKGLSTLFTCKFISRLPYLWSDGKLCVVCVCVRPAVVVSLYPNENVSDHCSHEDRDMHYSACEGCQELLNAIVKEMCVLMFCDMQ